MTTFPLPPEVAASCERRRQAETARLPKPCGAGTPEGLTCGAMPTRLYPRGYRCTVHAPADLIPDPERTLAALRARRGE